MNVFVFSVLQSGLATTNGHGAILPLTVCPDNLTVCLDNLVTLAADTGLKNVTTVLKSSDFDEKKGSG